MKRINLKDPYVADFHLTLDRPMVIMHNILSQARNEPARPDIHYSLHMGILLAGEFVSGIRDYRQVIRPGQVWLTSPWEPHTTLKAAAGSEILLCTFLLEKLGDVGPAGQDVSWLTPFILPPASRPQAKTKSQRETVIHLAEKLINTINYENRAQANCLSWLTLHELILTLISTMQPRNQQSKTQNFNFTRILPIIEYLKKNPGEVLGIDQAAELCSLGKSRFCDLFKQTIGVTYGKYAVHSRLSGAASDMKNTSFSVKEIAEKWGFYDESHFYRQFRSTFKCIPSEYRKK